MKLRTDPGIIGLILIAVPALKGQTPAPRPPEETIQLSPFTVTSEGAGYGATMGTSGRFAAPYLDTPQAASIVTSEFLRDAMLRDSNEALLYVPSIKNGSTIGNSQIVRGFTATATYSDGFANRGGAQFDTFFTDRIEVVKGPSSASFGRGAPAGFINYVSKRPESRNKTEVEYIWGSGNDDRDSNRLTLDHNGTLKDNTAYRFSAVFDQGAQSMAFSDYSRTGAHLAVAHNFKEKGRLDVFSTFARTFNPGVVNRGDMHYAFYRNLYSYLFHETGGVNVPDFPLLDPNNIQAPDGVGITADAFRITGILDYRLTENWSTRQAASYDYYLADGAIFNWNSFTVNKGANGTFMYPTSLNVFLTGQNSRTYQSDFLGKYDFGRWGKLALVVGGDVNNSGSVSASGQTTTATVQQPLFAWNSALPLGPWLANPNERGTAGSGWLWSYYTQGQLSYLDDRIQLTAATRKLFQDTRTRNRVNGAITKSQTRSPQMPTYSLLVKPNEWLSVFATTSKYLEPAQVSNRYGNLKNDIPANDPKRSELISSQPQSRMEEYGVKIALANGRFSLSLTNFQIHKTGTLGSRTVAYIAPDGSSSFYSEFYSSYAESSGWEVEGFGQLNRRLNFMFGGVGGTKSRTLAIWKSQFLYTQLQDVGDSAYGYFSYKFAGDGNNGLRVNAGWKTLFSGWSANSMPEKNIYPDDETFVNCGAAYGFKDRYEVTLNIRNALREDAFQHGNQSVISGRQVYVGFSATF